MLLIPTLTANAWTIGTAAVIGGAIWSIVISSLQQQVVPDDVSGRTSGVFRLFGYGALALGSVLAGIPAVFALCSALVCLPLVPFYRGIIPSLHEV